MKSNLLWSVNWFNVNHIWKMPLQNTKICVWLNNWHHRPVNKSNYHIFLAWPNYLLFLLLFILGFYWRVVDVNVVLVSGVLQSVSVLHTFCCCCLVIQSCLNLLQPHGLGFFQARILEWVAISFSRGSFWPRNGTGISCIAGRFVPTEPLGSPHTYISIFSDSFPW